MGDVKVSVLETLDKTSAPNHFIPKKGYLMPTECACPLNTGDGVDHAGWSED